MNNIDVFVKICAIWMIVLVVFSFLGDPFLIGVERKPKTAGDWLVSVISVYIPIAVLCGRCLGWW